MAQAGFTKWFGKQGFSLSRLRELFATGKDITAAAHRSLHVVLDAVEGASEEDVLALEHALSPQTTRAHVDFHRVRMHERLRMSPAADFAIVVASEDVYLQKAVVKIVTTWMRLGVPVALVVRSEEILQGISASVQLALAQEGTFSEDMGPARWTCICASSPQKMLSSLAKWIIDATDKDLALAANWPFLRDGVVRKIIMGASCINAAVGGIDILKRADFPLMAITQAQMAMKIAAAYGYEISLERIPEVLFILLSGLTMRGISHGLTAPFKHGKFLIKGAVGFAGTWVVGEALSQRFKQGQTVDIVLKDIEENSKEMFESFAETLSVKLGEITGGLIEIEPGAIYRAP